MAELRNRANVTYHTGLTGAPATFNWMDKKGTRTLSILYSWNNLNQFAYPGLGVRSEAYGYVQASANLSRCVAGVCKTDYSVSRLLVKTSGTSCQWRPDGSMGSWLRPGCCRSWSASYGS